MVLSEAAVFADKAQPKTLNRATGIVLVVLGIVYIALQYFIFIFTCSAFYLTNLCKLRIISL